MNEDITPVAEETANTDMTNEGNDIRNDDTANGENTVEIEVNPEVIAATAEYLRGRRELGTMIVLTVINIALIIFGSSWNFPFSALLPQIFAYGSTFEGAGILWYGAAAVSILLFVLSWVFCMEKPGWMVFALVLFIIDTAFAGLACFGDNVDAGCLVCIGFHIWVLYYLIKGVRAGFKLKKLFAAQASAE